MDISIIDISIICIYLIGIVIIGIYAGGNLKKQTSKDYFLGGRTLGWGVVGASLFASNISTIHIIGFAESGFKSGLLEGMYEWMAIPCLIFLGIFIAPFYFKNKIATIPEYFEKRYNGSARTFMVVFAIITALFLHIGISLYSGAAIMNGFFKIGIIPGILIISILTALYTILGGLKAVAITESIQSVLLLSGSIIITFSAIAMLPEVDIHSYQDFTERLKPGQLSMLHSKEIAAASGSDIPWFAVLLGYPVLGIWYWFTDQTIVQRALGAGSINDARKGPMFTALLKFAPVFFMLLPGVLAYVLFQQEIELAGTKQTFPLLIQKLLPVGLQGLVVASLLAALMSSVAAALNSSSTLFSIDILKRYYPETNDKKMVNAGRVAAFVVMVLAILWSMQANKLGEGIIHTVNQIGAMIAPPIASVFIIGYFWKRANGAGAVATLAIGLLLGFAVFIVDFPDENKVHFISETLGIHFLMQAFYLFVLSSMIFISVSLFTKPPTEAQKKLTFNRKIYLGDPIKSIMDYRIVGIILFLILIILWTILESIA